MQKLRWSSGFMVLLSLLALSIACGGKGEETTARPTVGTQPGPAAGAETRVWTRDDVLKKDPSVTKRGVLKLGAIFEVSGPLAAYGVANRDGLLLAVREINDSGGVQIGDTIYTIELVERDNRSDPSLSVSLATELVRDVGVKVIFGPAVTGIVASSRVTQSAKVIQLSPHPEQEEVLTPESVKDIGPNGRKWQFQTLTEFENIAKAGVKNLVAQLPQVRTVALICRDDDTGRTLCPIFEKVHRQEGLQVVAVEKYPPGTTDFSGVLTKLRAAQPDYLAGYTLPSESPIIIRQGLELGVAKVGYAANLPPAVAEAAIGFPLGDKVLIAGGTPRQASRPTSQEAAEYYERYRRLLGKDLPLAEFTSLLFYDYVYMVLRAMQLANTTTDTTAIANVLETMHYDGVASDDLHFNERHIAVHGSDSCVIRAGGDIACRHVQ
jgi:branched-chain amino acid transport system substrate-binding protein